MKENQEKFKWFGVLIGCLLLLTIILWNVINIFTKALKQDFVFNIVEIIVLVISISIIWVLGHYFGKLKVKGISFGTAGVFLVAIFFGYLFTQSFLKDIPILNSFYINSVNTNINLYYSKIIQNIGLILFVASVGFVAGPTFFTNLKKNGKVLILLVLAITLTSSSLAFCFALLPNIKPEFALGILAGSNTTTPGFSSAIEAADAINGSTELVKLGYAIAYPFGVIVIVLFVQVLPKIMKVDLEKEKKLIAKNKVKKIKKNVQLFKLDNFGLIPYAIAVLIGLLIGMIKIPLTLKSFNGPCFSLGTTGGILLSAIIFGHFSQIGKLSLEVNAKIVKNLREIGLILFLIGSGVSGGVSLVSQISELGGSIVIYGVIASIVLGIVPLIIGFIVSTKLLKLGFLESLASITGGRTSTPALGMLIETAKTTDVAGFYASTYPIALVIVVLIPQIILMILG